MSIWTNNVFPTHDCKGKFTKKSGRYESRYTLVKPYCWTPTESFYFGGKRYLALYPCASFETKNFGWVVQRMWDRTTIGRE